MRERVEGLLTDSARWTGGKQQLTATRLHELLVAEGQQVGVTVVKEAVAEISLAQENESLPAFMRFGGNTAYVEGWALYAETLGPELGLFKDPDQRFGQLNDEMLRAMRLVVDTGIHAKAWTRQQGIDYMLANSGMSRTDVTAEVERYMRFPARPSRIKIGALTIQRLKAKAQQELGGRFDIRRFHEQVLMTGALPLTVLEQKLADWVAAAKEQVLDFASSPRASLGPPHAKSAVNRHVAD